jgi:structural maintenance of chromosomes flexible hinge domain-containing protein 1
MTTGNPKPGTSKKGLVCIADNGCGMTKQELNEWAVMNYSMQERGVEPREPEAAIRGNAATGAGRFLTGDLSFFGVGSKNAAFFMGSFVKVSTRKAGERYVHELSLAAADLEARYRNQQAVYEEDMVHRNPGDHSTANAIEQAFPAAREWVRAEVEPGEESFTRVIIGDLKADVIDQLVSDDEGAHICTELAHLYHYYLHGENGNRKSVEADESLVNRVLPNGEPLPRISLRRCVDLKVLWERSLAEVDEDFETRILRGQRSELSFTLGVPQRGVVTGVLYYFPFEGDRETVPMEDGHPWSNWRDRSYSRASTAGTQAMGAKDVAQLPVVRTQAGATGGLAAVTAQTQYGVGGPLSAETQDTGSDDDDAGARTWRTPTFEAFWQGRLIPGARIDSLPFIESVRQKRNAHARDVIPDEAFGRLRGALFFGPAFRVTRNK